MEVKIDTMLNGRQSVFIKKVVDKLQMIQNDALI